MFEVRDFLIRRVFIYRGPDDAGRGVEPAQSSDEHKHLRTCTRTSLHDSSPRTAPMNLVRTYRSFVITAPVITAFQSDTTKENHACSANS
jgi:hypothetical protein